MTELVENLGVAENHNAQSVGDDAVGGEAPLQGMTQPGLDHFSGIGHRLLAVDMLTESLRVLAEDPQSAEAVHERNWLLGVGDSAVPASFCFDAISSGGVDALVAAQTFIKACGEDPAGLKRALQKASSSIRFGTFEYDSQPQAMDRSGGYTLRARGGSY